MSRLLLMLSLLQGDGTHVDASVDRDRVSVGEELVYTLRAVSHSPLPMQVTVQPFIGLEIISRSERTEVSAGAAPTRTTVLEVRLRAARPGRWELGPARAVQGRDTVEAAPVVVDVTGRGAAGAAALNPRLNRLLDRAVPPPPGQAAVDLIVSTDSVRVGEQVDVITAAWFPRDLRLQLRRPPTLQPPVIDGVWSYPQSTPAGIAATRNIGGVWYDLFVGHQVVFPLVPGTLPIPRATLKYSTPIALQFFSQEERFALTSRAETLVVRALPAEGRPADFAGAIGSQLSLQRRITPRAARVGEAVTVELEVAGEGNTALWPAPEVRWPERVRAYADKVEERVTTTEGRIGGTKIFHYLVVPDSAGGLGLPAVSYPYFDLAAGRYLSVGVLASSVPVVPSGLSGATGALPPALLAEDRPAFAWRLAHNVPDWAWIAILLLPPFALALRHRLPRLRRRRPPLPPQSDLRSAEEELEELVRALIPDLDHRSGPGLAAALRAAGADADLASRVAAARERLFARRYSPEGSSAENPALAAETRELVRRLGGSLRSWPARGAAAVFLALGLHAGLLAAQAPGPERLYRTGSLAAAAEGFSRRAAEQPAVAAHWYNLGAAYYRQGLEGRAAAAWLQGRRLAPRESAIARALELTPPPDPLSARWSWSPPVTAEELLLLGSLGWLAGWLGWTVRPRHRERWLVLLVFAGSALLGGLSLRMWNRRPLAVVLDQTTLRLSPHGRAPSVAPLEPGGALRIVGRSPGWLMVRAPGALNGWVVDEAVARIGG